MGNQDKIDHNLFVPPVGFIRSLPENKRDEYIKKYQALGPITKHEYDLDICVLSRQMSDLLSRYKKKYNGFDFHQYEKQIRDSVASDLQKMGLDPEFYIDHYYYVINPSHPSYKTYLGIFIALSNPLSVVPILYRHLEEFLADDKSTRTAEDFFNMLEYRVCNFLRTNRFPEDYFAKHDKVMNWVHGKKDFEKFQSEITTKFDGLISALNKMTGSNIPNEIVTEKRHKKQKDVNPVQVIEKMREILFNDLSDFFGEKTHHTLKQFLGGNAESTVKILFNGQANQLVDVFRIYAVDGFIEADKKAIAIWIVEHFLYFNEIKDRIENFDTQATLNMIYGQRPPTKNKRIPLKDILKPRFAYYGKKPV